MMEKSSNNAQNHLIDKFFSLAKESTFTLISRVIYSALMLLTSIMLARLLGPHQFGIFSILLSLQLFVSSMAHLEVPTATTKFISQFITNDQKVSVYVNSSKFIIFISSFSAWIMFFLSSNFMSMIYNFEISSTLIAIVLMRSLFIPFYRLFHGILRGYQKIGTYNLIVVIDAILYSSSLIILTNFFNLLGAVVGLALHIAILLVISSLSFGKVIPGKSLLSVKRDKIKSEEILFLLKFAVPTFLPAIFGTFSGWFTITILAIESGYNEVAFFGIAFSICQMILYLPRSISFPFFPSIRETLSRSMEESIAIISKVTKISIYLILPIALFLSFFPHQIIGILYGQEYSNVTTSNIIILGAAAIFIFSSIIPLVDALLALGKVKEYCLIYFFQYLILIGLSLVLIPIYGGIGLILSYLVSYSIYAILIRHRYTVNFKHKISILLFFLVIFVPISGFSIVFIRIIFNQVASMIVATILFLLVALFCVLKLKNEGFFKFL
ncbi:MAG: oligosaccharide flippase family protein [Promethearchaeota archaeon]